MRKDHEDAACDLRPVLDQFIKIILIDPEKLGTSEHFQKEIDGFLAWMLEAPPAEGFDKVRIAGEPERASKAKRLKDGIAVDQTTWKEIQDAAVKVGMKAADVGRIAGV